MKTSQKARTARTKSRSHSAAGSSTSKPYARAVRERLVAKIFDKAEVIIDKVIESAEAGNYLPTKFLFEFACLADPAGDADAAAEALSRARSLAEILFDAFDAMQELSAQPNPQETSAG
jgi:hypothetical protein